IIYSTTEPTTGNVTIKLNNLFPAEKITITNNGGSDTFVFTENGEFTFRFVNEQGVEGSATAVVSWIDREPPTPDIEYSTDKPVKDKVVVTLIPNEDITVLRDDIKYRVDEQGNVIDLETENDPTVEDKTQAILNGYSVDDEGYVIDPLGKKIANINPFRFEFTENGTYTVEYVDRAGNKNSSEIVIDLIDNTLPDATLSYDYDSLTNKDVTVTIGFNIEAPLTNNNGSFTYTFTQNGTFTFEYVDGAGNAGSITATVDWINKTAPQATLSYDKTEATNQNVTVTVSFDKDGVTVTNNGGKTTYTFTQNGTFTFEYVDGAGNAGSITATVDWIEVKPVIEYDKSKKDVAVIK
ncbi:MAG: hypothetical protein K2I29_01745, partial [Clostridia bacterium]|nr:hypothetical protein [Clostridia bacterium]